MLLLPPLAGIFQSEAKLFGIPVTLLYLFAIWLALIVGTAWLSQALTRGEDSTDRRP